MASVVDSSGMVVDGHGAVKNKYRDTGKGGKCNVHHVYDDNVHEAINVSAFEILPKRINLINYIIALTGLTKTKVTREKIYTRGFIGGI